MPQAKGKHLNRPYLHVNLSNSLDGMEKSIPSFQDFMKTVPPNPSSDKPLPIVPPLQQRPELSPARSASHQTSSFQTTRSEGSSWMTPSSWDYYEDPALRHLVPPKDHFLQPAAYTVSSPNLDKPEKPRSPLEHRTFSPLLDDPDLPPSTPHSAATTPAFEYEMTVHFPPESPATREPPRSPLPPIPTTSHVKEKKRFFERHGLPTPPSPAMDSGSVSPLARPIVPERQSSSRSNLSFNPSPLKKLVPRSAAPGTEDEQEDLGESAPLMQGRRSQDYHRALIEQYRELVPRTSEIFRDSVISAQSEAESAVEKILSYTEEYRQGRTLSKDSMMPKPLSYSPKTLDGRRKIIDNTPEPRHPDQFEPEEPQETSRRRSSLREKVAGTLKMILPSHHVHKMSVNSGDILISPPANYDAFAPKRIPHPLAVASIGTKPSPKTGKKGGKGMEHIPPLKLELAASLSSKTSSPRPSTSTERSGSRRANQINWPLSAFSSPSSSASRSPSRLAPRLDLLEHAPLSPGSTHSAPAPRIQHSASPLRNASPATTGVSYRAQSPAGGSGLSGGSGGVGAAYPRPMTRLPGRNPDPFVAASTSLLSRAKASVLSAAPRLGSGASPSSSSPSSLSAAAAAAVAGGSESRVEIRYPHLPFVHEKVPRVVLSPPPLSSSWEQEGQQEKQQKEHRRLSLVKRAVEAHREHQREKRRTEIKKSIRVLGTTDPAVVEGYVRDPGMGWL